jgi:hypothetical protein
LILWVDADCGSTQSFRIFPQKFMRTLVGGDSWNTSRWQRKGLVTSHWGQFPAFLMRLEAGCRSTASNMAQNGL